MCLFLTTGIRQNPSKTGLFARTDRKMAAQMGKSPHGRNDGPHGMGDRPHGLKNRRTNRETRARMGKSAHGNKVVPHGSKEWLSEAIFACMEPRFARRQ
jgi:hypothetical protein